MRPIVFHPRMDFMLLAMDPIVNQAANWSYLFPEARQACRVVIRAVINRGGEQGAQHSQALHAMFMHVPGLKVVMPSTPSDAKGLLIAAVEDPNPVLYIDDRWSVRAHAARCPEPCIAYPIGAAAVRRTGADVTLIGISSMACEALIAAASSLAARRHRRRGDRFAQPQALGSAELVLASVRKTGRRGDRRSGMENRRARRPRSPRPSAQKPSIDLRAPVERVTLPDAPAPASRAEEQAPIFPARGRSLTPRWARRCNRQTPGESNSGTSSKRNRGEPRREARDRSTPGLVRLIFLRRPLALIALAVWLDDRRSPFFAGIAGRRGGARVPHAQVPHHVAGRLDSRRQLHRFGRPRASPAMGGALRKRKLDELPQLMERADRSTMSLVGPRPQVPADADLYTVVEWRLFDARPGITDLASIVFADEGEILRGSRDPDLAYHQVIRPWKSRLALAFISNMHRLRSISGFSPGRAVAFSRRPRARSESRGFFGSSAPT